MCVPMTKKQFLDLLKKRGLDREITFKYDGGHIYTSEACLGHKRAWAVRLLHIYEERKGRDLTMVD